MRNIDKKGVVEFDLDYFEKTGRIVPISEPLELVCVKRKRRGNIVLSEGIFDTLDLIGGAKIRVLTYLLRNMDNTGCVNVTVSDISRDLDLTRVTVTRVIDRLKSGGFIERKADTFMLSEKIVKGSS